MVDYDNYFKGKVEELDSRLDEYQRHINIAIAQANMARMQDDMFTLSRSLDTLEDMLAKQYPTDNYLKELTKLNNEVETEMFLMKNTRGGMNTQRMKEFWYKYLREKYTLIFNILRDRGMLPKKSEYSVF